MFKDIEKKDVINIVISLITMTLFALIAYWYWFGLRLK